MKTRQPLEAEGDRILACFIEVVAERGYRSTPLQAVLDRAEIDEETFRHYFDDKEACFHAAWSFVNERYIPNALAAYEGAEGWRAQIRAVALAMLHYLSEHPDHARILFLESPTPDEPVRTALDPKVEIFIELIDRGRLEMDDPDSVTRATAEGIAGAVIERIVRSLRRGADEELPGLLPDLLYLVVRPYLGSEVAAEELRRGVG